MGKGGQSLSITIADTESSSVIQRQLWLQDNEHLAPGHAYEKARKEFYDLRLQEDVERRIAREEAISTGAYFGPSRLDIGMELEDQEYERWKTWAQNEVDLREQKNSAMYSGGTQNEDMALEANEAEHDAALEEVTDQIPAQGQGALGGAMIHP